MTTLHQMQRDLIAQFATALENMGCEYFIRHADGTKANNVDMVTKDEIKKSAHLMYGRGVLTNYLRPHMDGIQSGQVAFVPHGEYDHDLLLQAARSYGGKLWGNGTCKAMADDQDRDGFLVFRAVPMVKA